MIGVWATITILVLGFNVLVFQLKKMQRKQRDLEEKYLKLKEKQR